jgi:hypothetical protein
MIEEASVFYDLARLWSDLDSVDEEAEGAEMLDSQVGVGSEVDG